MQYYKRENPTSALSLDSIALRSGTRVTGTKSTNPAQTSICCTFKAFCLINSNCRTRKISSAKQFSAQTNVSLPICISKPTAPTKQTWMCPLHQKLLFKRNTYNLIVSLFLVKLHHRDLYHQWWNLPTNASEVFVETKSSLQMVKCWKQLASMNTYTFSLSDLTSTCWDSWFQSPRHTTIHCPGYPDVNSGRPRIRLERRAGVRPFHAP